MSVRCNGIGQHASLAQALSISTGNFFMGAWVRGETAHDGPFYALIDSAWDAGETTFAWMRALTSNTLLRGHTTGGFIGGYSSASLSTWYYVGLTRDGSTLRFRVLDDSSSTTPLYDATATDSSDYDTLDNIHLFSHLNGEYMNGEMCSVKLVTGSFTLTDAELRTESQNLDIVKSGGTLRYAWDLEDTDADVQGFNERGGSGPNFTNTSLVNGASRPSQLEAAGGSTTTFYLLDSAASGSNFGQLQTGGSPPSTATTATGWTVDTVASGNYALMAYASERLSSTFSGTAQPAGNPDNSLGDCFRSTSTMSGDFATGVWTIAVPVIAVSAAAGQDGRVRVRLWKSANATGTSPTELTSGAVAGTTVTNLTTGAEQISTVTTSSITGFSMANEYLFVQIAWEITGAAT